MYRPGYGPSAGQPGAYPVAYSMPDPRQTYSRQALLRDYTVIREIDLVGYYHPAEITRKISREFTRLGFHITEENTDIRKNPVGQATGETFGYLRAGASHNVNPAGHVSYFNSGAFAATIILLILLAGLSLLGSALSAGLGIVGSLLILVLVLIVVYRERLFRRSFAYSARIDVDFAVGIPGEIYEDFRADAKNPIRTNVSVIVAGKTTSVRITQGDQERWFSQPATRHAIAPDFPTATQYWNTRVSEVVHVIASGLESARETV